MSAIFSKKTNAEAEYWGVCIVKAEYKGKLNIGGCPPALIPRGGAERRAAAIVSQLPPPGVNNLPLFRKTLQECKTVLTQQCWNLFFRRGHSHALEGSRNGMNCFQSFLSKLLGAARAVNILASNITRAMTSPNFLNFSNYILNSMWHFKVSCHQNISFHWIHSNNSCSNWLTVLLIFSDFVLTSNYR